MLKIICDKSITLFQDGLFLSGKYFGSKTIQNENQVNFGLKNQFFHSVKSVRALNS